MIGTAISAAQRPGYLALLGATINLAQAFGPLIGGALVARATWRTDNPRPRGRQAKNVSSRGGQQETNWVKQGGAS